jgi:hypothetical protein
MRLIARACSALGIAALLYLLVPAAALAQSCSSNAGCPADQTCQPVLFGMQCRNMPCNFDAECPFDRPFCFGGLCQAGCRRAQDCGAGLRCVGGNQFRLGTCSPRLPPAPPPQPGGIGQAGEGQACGRVSIGGVVKNVGCRQGLQCRNGRCRRLEQ